MIIRFHQRTARLSCAASKSENKGRCFGRFEVLMNSRKAAWSSSVRTKPFVQAHLPCHSPSTSTVGKAQLASTQTQALGSTATSHNSIHHFQLIKLPVDPTFVHVLVLLNGESMDWLSRDQRALFGSKTAIIYGSDSSFGQRLGHPSINHLSVPTGQGQATIHQAALVPACPMSMHIIYLPSDNYRSRQ